MRKTHKNNNSIKCDTLYTIQTSKTMIGYTDNMIKNTNKKTKDYIMNKMTITNTRNIKVQKLDYVEPKDVYRHTIRSHSKVRYITGGYKPYVSISSVYKAKFAAFKTPDVISHIAKYRKSDKEAA